MLHLRRANSATACGLEMVRQTSVSTLEETPNGVEAPDLGDWLTQALRAKGSLVPSRPPPEPPPPRPSEVEVQGPDASLGGWLALDLTPKHSVRPPLAMSEEVVSEDADGPEASSHELAPLPESADRAAEAAPDLTLTSAGDFPRAAEPEASTEPVLGFAAARPSPAQDSLAPLMVSPPQTAIAGDLDEDDLSVLPGRRKSKAAPKSGSGSKKYALGVLGLLLLTGAFLTQRGRAPDGSQTDANHVASAPEVAAALPPPPTDVDEPAEPEENPRVPRVAHGKRAGVEEPEELADPRSFLGGPSVRRYADVASPTLSKLASEQRRLQRQRDEAARNKAKAERKAAP
jgi:hypothetical protein